MPISEFLSGTHGISLLLAIIAGVLFGYRAYQIKGELFEFWFNFLGGFVGVMALRFLWDTPIRDYGWPQLWATWVALFGLSGYLPNLLWTLKGRYGKRVYEHYHIEVRKHPK